MTFRLKLGIAFLCVLFLMMLATVTSWWGLNKALEHQEALFTFNSDLERHLHQLIRDEQAFVAGRELTHSRAVLVQVEAIRMKIETVLEHAREDGQNTVIRQVLQSLDEYRAQFSSFMEHDVAMRTMESRMLLESQRISANADDLWGIGVNVHRFERLIGTALIAERDYLLWGRQEDVKRHSRALEEIVALAGGIQEATDNNAVKLKVFRIARIAGVYQDIFKQFAASADRQKESLAAMGFSLEQLKQELVRYISLESAQAHDGIERLKNLTVIIALCALFTALVATFLLSKFITRPINQLKSLAKQVVDGQLDISVEVSGTDEIGELGRIFNLMTTRLKNSFDSINHYKNHLEELVRERTGALEMENRERRQAEAALRDSEARFRAFFDHASDGILIVDPLTSHFVSANSKLCGMLGYGAKDIGTLRIENIHLPEDLPGILGKFEKMRDGRMSMAKDIPVLRADGEIFYADITSARFEINGRKYLMASFRDTTERKRLEEEIHKRRKLESIGVLAGGIAHDFNNILAGILGNVSLAKDDLRPDEENFQLLTEVERASLRARDLTRQLLTFAKGGEPVMQIASIVEVIRDSAGFVLRGSNVLCEYHVAEDLHTVQIDPGQISQVIQNIVVNARHAMPDGGLLDITCRNLAPERLGTLGLSAEQAIEIVIEDHGIGISKGHLDKIFDPYFSTKQEGSGLGLAITHSIIAKHGGQITAESEQGKGTTFTIILPALDDRIVPQRPAREQAAPPTGNGKILVMDDEKMIRDLASRMLSRFGYEVDVASDGEEAVRRYEEAQKEKTPFDLVIMDLTIPGGMGGKEAVGRILESDPTAKVIVSSGYSNDPVMARYKEYGFCGIVAKPFEIGDVLHTIRQILESRQG